MRPKKKTKPSPRLHREPVQRGSAEAQSIIDQAINEQALPDPRVSKERCTPIKDTAAYYTPSFAEDRGGRMASDVKTQKLRYFLPEPIVLSGALTMLVGEAGTGKSSIGAWMAAMADRPAFLPGYEEDADTFLVPRLDAHGVNLADCLLLDQRTWVFPRHRRELTEILQAQRCDLLWIDPIDSYIGDISENDGQLVRAALESLAIIAREVGCAIVLVRHPGKLAGNLCPGSRQWRAVPRVVLEVRKDDGPPIRRTIRANKVPCGAVADPLTFEVTGSPNEPGILTMGKRDKESLSDAVSVSDPLDRLKICEARDIIESMLQDGEQEAMVIYERARQEGIGDRLVRLAAERLGVQKKREGSGRNHTNWWWLGERRRHSGTLAMPDGHTSPPQ